MESLTPFLCSLAEILTYYFGQPYWNSHAFLVLPWDCNYLQHLIQTSLDYSWQGYYWAFPGPCPGPVEASLAPCSVLAVAFLVPCSVLEVASLDPFLDPVVAFLDPYLVPVDPFLGLEVAFLGSYSVPGVALVAFLPFYVEDHPFLASYLVGCRPCFVTLLPCFEIHHSYYGVGLASYCPGSLPFFGGPYYGAGLASLGFWPYQPWLLTVHTLGHLAFPSLPFDS